MKSKEIELIARIELCVIKGDSFLPLPDEKNNRLYINEYDLQRMFEALNTPANPKCTFAGTGRKPIREKQYGKVVRELRKDGKTIREIAEYVGISTSTVQKILKAQQDKKGS